MQQLELFTQKAYLSTAAIEADSKIIDCADLAYVRSAVSPERWSNAVVRCLYKPQNFSRIEKLIQDFDTESINFNWHLWPSSDPALRSYLENSMRLTLIGYGRVLSKSLTESPNLVQSDQNIEFGELKQSEFKNYIDAKTLAWGNSQSDRIILSNAAKALLKDQRNKVYILKVDKNIVGAGGCFIENGKAYLRGSFIVPEFRNQGLYAQLVLLREKPLFDCGVTELVTIADSNTSAKTLQKLNYSEYCEISILARRSSRWLSL